MKKKAKEESIEELTVEELRSLVGGGSFPFCNSSFGGGKPDFFRCVPDKAPFSGFPGKGPFSGGKELS